MMRSWKKLGLSRQPAVCQVAMCRQISQWLASLLCRHKRQLTDIPAQKRVYIPLLCELSQQKDLDLGKITARRLNRQQAEIEKILGCGTGKYIGQQKAAIAPHEDTQAAALKESVHYLFLHLLRMPMQWRQQHTKNMPVSPMRISLRPMECNRLRERKNQVGIQPGNRLAEYLAVCRQLSYLLQIQSRAGRIEQASRHQNRLLPTPGKVYPAKGKVAVAIAVNPVCVRHEIERTKHQGLTGIIENSISSAVGTIEYRQRCSRGSQLRRAEGFLNVYASYSQLPDKFGAPILPNLSGFSGSYFWS